MWLDSIIECLCRLYPMVAPTFRTSLETDINRLTYLSEQETLNDQQIEEVRSLQESIEQQLPDAVDLDESLQSLYEQYRIATDRLHTGFGDQLDQHRQEVFEHQKLTA